MRIKTRRGKPWIVVPALEVLSAPPNIDALHREVAGRNGTIDLLDVLKEAEHLSSFADELTSIASREITDPETAKRRKLLVSFALGANIEIKRIADAIDGHPADTEAALRRMRRIYVNREGWRHEPEHWAMFGCWAACRSWLCSS